MTKHLMLVLLVLASLSSRAAAQQAAVSVGRGPGSAVSSQNPSCGTLYLTSDGVYESGWAWAYGGIASPYFGAFAECYFDAGMVCAAVFDLTQAADQKNQVMDVYIWDDLGGAPGAVLCLIPGIDPGPIAYWPVTSRHTVEIPGGCCTGLEWWIGYWGDWPGQHQGWFVGADLEGGPWERLGCPYTNVAPGLGFPTGWANVNTVWGPTAALGIGAEVVPCEPTPNQRRSWGAIKALYGGPRQ